MMPRIDKLMWGIAADALSVVVAQVGTLVKASAVHPEAAGIARERIDRMRQLASMLDREADRLAGELDGGGGLPTLAEQAAAFDASILRMPADEGAADDT